MKIEQTTTFQYSDVTQSPPLINLTGRFPSDCRAPFERGNVQLMDRFVMPPLLQEFARFRKKNADRSCKKLKSWRPEMIHKAYGADSRLVIERLTDLKRSLHAWVSDWFKAYEISFEDLRYTFRPTPTGPEDMHYDVYDDGGVTIWRAFINLDMRPRVWRTSWSFTEAFGRWGKKGGKGILARELNPRLRDQPYSEFLMAPGALWMVHSQKASHQVVSGRMMAAFEAPVKTERLADPSSNYADMVKELRA